jgi:hypothetical protein
MALPLYSVEALVLLLSVDVELEESEDLADSDELDGLDEPLVLPPPLVLCLLVPRLSLM